MKNQTSFALLVAIVGALSLVIVFCGPPPISIDAADHAAFLDAAWRILNGQIPHNDFFCPIGAFPCFWWALGMRLFGGTIRALTLSNVMLLPPLSFLAWFVARSRVGNLGALFFSVLTGFTVVSQASISASILSLSSYAMLYNRYAYGLLLLVLMITLISPRGGHTAPSHALLAGIAAGLLLFCKFNFFGVATGGIVLGIFLYPPSKKSVVFLLIGFTAVLVVFFELLSISPKAFLHDFQTLASIGRVSPVIPSHLYRLSYFTKSFFCLASSALVLFVFFIRYSKAGFPCVVIPLIATGYVLASSIALTLTNSQHNDPILAAFCAMILIEAAVRVVPFCSHERVGRFFTGGIVLILSPILFTALVKDITSFVFPFVASHMKYEKRPFNIDRLNDFSVIGLVNTSSVNSQLSYVSSINDGLQLLHPHLNGSTRLHALDYTNLFNVALHLPPPHAGMLCWDYGFSFFSNNFESPDAVLADVNLVIVPKAASNNVARLKQLYLPAVLKDFTQVDESAHWILYGKRNPVDKE